MATETLKSTLITNLDATPIVRNTVGAGAAGDLRTIGDYVTVPASASTGSTFRLVRVPSNAKIKEVVIESEAQGAGKVNLSVYYSDCPTDGTPQDKLGIIVPTTGSAFFASDVDLASLVTPTDVTNESTNYNLSKRNQPLWQALGLTANPGGYLDIVAVVNTTAVTTGTGKLGVRVSYVE